MERPISTTLPLPPALDGVDGDGEEHEGPEDGAGAGDEMRSRSSAAGRKPI